MSTPTAPAKVSRRLLPFLFPLYIVCFLDRVNVGFAALQMNHDLGLSPAVYGFGAGAFFLAYVLFEVPSNLILARVGARVWIALRVAHLAGRSCWGKRGGGCSVREGGDKRSG